MPLYLVYRDDKDVNWNQLREVVVRARNPAEARILASKQRGSEGESVWLNTTQSHCKRLPEEGKSKVLCVDFHEA